MLSLGIYIIGSLVVIVILHYWRNLKSNGKLPPGSMGWPLLGETIPFFAPNTSLDISPFVKERMQRYGPIFRTSLVGHPIIVSTDPDFNYFIFQQEGKLFQSWYPHTFAEIMGRQNVGSFHGFMYKYLKNMVLNLFGPESLRKMLPEVEKTTNNNLKRWSKQKSVEMKEATAKMIFDITGKKLISYDSENSTENVCENFVAFVKGLISFPIYFPGTAYYKCLQGRKKTMKMLKRMLEERKSQPRKEQSDFFDYVLEELQSKDTILTEAIALDLMFVLLFVSFETTSWAITLAIKFLHQHPQALKELKVRYTIPAGWAIMVYSQAVHLNPTKYEDPLQFNPWRWKGIELNGATRNFMAFGGGIRYCIGADFAKVQMAVFLHCFVTKYK
uniref:Cytochrome P450 n=1 Tax=Solanum lycopersicum TaxID=4081 RepID=A0A3Q7HKZ1_SOLLC